MADNLLLDVEKVIVDIHHYHEDWRRTLAPRLQNKIAFISGGASGIGRASALRFASEGAKVVVGDIHEDNGVEVCETILRMGGHASFVLLDVTDEDSVARAFETVDAEHGTLHVLYNCAGGSTSRDASVDALELEVLHNTLALDLTGTILCSRSGVPRLIASGGGSVINMSSSGAYRANIHAHAYVAAKGAISSLTRAMAGSYARDGVRVNAIAPGLVLTERARARMAQMAESAEIADTTTNPLSSGDYPFATGRPEDLANVALFLASDESIMFTGETLMATGGLTAY